MSHQSGNWASFLSDQPQRPIDPSFIDFDLPNFGLTPTEISESLEPSPNDLDIR